MERIAPASVSSTVPTPAFGVEIPGDEESRVWGDQLIKAVSGKVAVWLNMYRVKVDFSVGKVEDDSRVVNVVEIIGWQGVVRDVMFDVNGCPSMLGGGSTWCVIESVARDLGVEGRGSNLLEEDDVYVLMSENEVAEFMNSVSDGVTVPRGDNKR